jgi:hypothetical protein
MYHIIIMAREFGMARRVLLLSTVLVALTAILVPGSQAHDLWGPRLLIQEDVSGTYLYDGSVDTAATMTGQFKVAVPNDDDVLQYINIDLNSGFDTYTNIDSTTGTDRAYQNALTSQPINDFELLFVNTTSNDADSSYEITSAAQAPTINLSMYYENERGGQDMYDERNIDDPDNNITVVFSMYNPGTSNLVGINADIQFSTSADDEPEIIDLDDTQGGTATSSSTGGDASDDHIDWDGVTVNSETTVNLTVVLNITSGVHISQDSITLDDGGTDMDATYTSSGELFSEITVLDKFARGPIRQGVDLSSNSGTWYVRGFIRNMGYATGASNYNLTYNITDWYVYSVDPSTGAPYSSENQTGSFNQTESADEFTPANGRVYTTDSVRSSNNTMFNSSSSSKPYMALRFDWEVFWNGTGSEINTSNINTSMSMTTLYLVDLTLDKSLTGIVSPLLGGDNVTINDTLTNIGHTNTDPNFVQIISYVPNNTTLGNWRGSGWDIDNTVQVYVNSTYQINPDGTNCVVTVTDPQEGAEGTVNFTAYSFTACDLNAGGTVGDVFDETEVLTLSYVITSDAAMTTGDIYEFWSIGQLNSTTNTMDREFNSEYPDANETVTVSGKRMTGYKELIGKYVNIPTLINATILLNVEDSSGTGITGIKFMDYIPNVDMNYAQYVGNVTVRHYNGSWNSWDLGTDYNIHDNGTAQLPDGITVQLFEFVNGTDNSTWNLTDGEQIEVTYQINFTTAGAYSLPTIISAFDPDTGASLQTTFYGVVKITIPEPNIPLTIDEGTLKQSKTVLVGKPAVWTKEFDVYNPNPRQVDSTFEALIFEDATDGYVTYFDENGRKIEESIMFAKNSDGERVMRWNSVMNPFENRNYEVVVLTAPVMEIDRDIEVLQQLDNKKVRLKMDVYLKSFSKENYQNVVLNLPIGYENIEEVRDGFGNKLPFTGGMDTTTITVDSMAADELKTITVIYQESYPTVIITPDRDRYNLNSPVSLEILVINGGEKIDYPFLEVEIYTPGMDVLFTDMTSLESMEPLEKTETYEKFVIPATAPGGMYIASAKFREDFAVLASTTGNFYVLGIAGGIPEGLEIIIILLVISILAFFSWKRLKEVRNTRTPTYGGI